jgi:hypothetical protein
VPKLKDPAGYGARIRERYPKISPAERSLESVETELALEDGDCLGDRWN